MAEEKRAGLGGVDARRGRAGAQHGLHDHKAAEELESSDTTLGKWCCQAERDEGEREGVSSDEQMSHALRQRSPTPSVGS